jgi:hypothetical protein
LFFLVEKRQFISLSSFFIILRQSKTPAGEKTKAYYSSQLIDQPKTTRKHHHPKKQAEGKIQGWQNPSSQKTSKTQAWKRTWERTKSRKNWQNSSSQ